eukprot:gnl/Spiro4/11313_TR5970_c0_g1_i1.p1 gnl/Spiro4/11313_TR5970_c0_g1~~gnl/Spiro4/11313_TR5970_c0_g1_i1.p1  ORF type:complete len:151 (+),score=26.38 gnl/Spiro4/11313_TR5970_c0_g1_i1:52-504(+)
MAAARKINRDFAEMNAGHPLGCTAGPVGDNLYQWHATIPGPPESPYSGGVFYMNINIPVEYPMKPPSCTFATRIYHPSVLPDGHFCLDVLSGDGWKAIYSMSSILTSIYNMLAAPEADGALNAEAGQLLASDPAAFRERAVQWTRDYASN